MIIQTIILLLIHYYAPQVPILQFEQRKGKDDNELWYKGGNNRIVIFVSSNTAFAEFLTLFAALFTIRCTTHYNL